MTVVERDRDAVLKYVVSVLGGVAVSVIAATSPGDQRFVIGPPLLLVVIVAGMAPRGLLQRGQGERQGSAQWAQLLAYVLVLSFPVLTWTVAASAASRFLVLLLPVTCLWAGASVFGWPSFRAQVGAVGAGTGVAVVGVGVAVVMVGVPSLLGGVMVLRLRYMLGGAAWLLAGIAVLLLGLAVLLLGVSYLRSGYTPSKAGFLPAGVATALFGVVQLSLGHAVAGVAVLLLGVAVLRSGRTLAKVAVLLAGAAVLLAGAAVLLVGVAQLRSGFTLAGVPLLLLGVVSLVQEPGSPGRAFDPGLQDTPLSD